MSVATVGRLREVLEEYPDHMPIAIRIVVGGDLGTDDVDLANVFTTGSGASGPYVALEPVDVYGLRDQLDNALAVFYAIADAEALGNGYVQYTRLEDGELILDHINAARVVILDEAKR